MADQMAQPESNTVPNPDPASKVPMPSNQTYLSRIPLEILHMICRYLLRPAIIDISGSSPGGHHPVQREIIALSGTNKSLRDAVESFNYENLKLVHSSQVGDFDPLNTIFVVPFYAPYPTVSPNPNWWTIPGRLFPKANYELASRLFGRVKIHHSTVRHVVFELGDIQVACESLSGVNGERFLGILRYFTRLEKVEIRLPVGVC